MSAIAKPMVVPTAHATLISGAPVAVEEIITIDKGRESGGTPGTQGNYSIVFRMKTVDHTIRDIKWEYAATAAGSTERNTRYTALVGVVAATV